MTAQSADESVSKPDLQPANQSSTRDKLSQLIPVMSSGKLAIFRNRVDELGWQNPLRLSVNYPELQSGFVFGHPVFRRLQNPQL